MTSSLVLLVASTLVAFICSIRKLLLTRRVREDVFPLTEVGNLISTYRKTHVWYTDVFDSPQPALVNFTTSFGVNFGMMICFDIAFGFPGPELVSKGITHFPYSVAQGLVCQYSPDLWRDCWTISGKDLDLP